MLKLAVIIDVFSRLAEFFGTSRGAVVEKLINVAAIWIASWLSYQLVKRIARRALSHMDRQHADATPTAAEKRGQTIAEVVRSVGRLIILVLAVLLTAAQFIPIAPLIAAGGILGLAVSFGSQSLVKDVLAGFFILFENQFALGDVIEAGGEVASLGKDPAWKSRLEGASEVGVEDLSEHAVMVRTMLRTVPGPSGTLPGSFGGGSRTGWTPRAFPSSPCPPPEPLPRSAHPHRLHPTTRQHAGQLNRSLTVLRAAA